MKVYSFSEQSYPDAWFEDAESLRVSLPNRHCDPEMAARLYNRYLDEWMLADELGLNIIVNEHHATATCMSASVHLTLAILARQTKRAAPRTGHPHCEPQRSPARRGGNVDHRCDLPRPAGDGVHQRRSL